MVPDAGIIEKLARTGLAAMGPDPKAQKMALPMHGKRKDLARLGALALIYDGLKAAGVIRILLREQSREAGMVSH